MLNLETKKALRALSGAWRKWQLRTLNAPQPSNKLAEIMLRLSALHEHRLKAQSFMTMLKNLKNGVVIQQMFEIKRLQSQLESTEQQSVGIDLVKREHQQQMDLLTMDFEARTASRLEEQEAKDAKIDDFESVHRILRL